jgi:hypothetical protein
MVTMFPPATLYKNEINATLYRLIEHGEQFSLTTVYKGIPLTQNVSRIEIESNCVQFRPPHQICGVVPGQKIYIHHDKLPRSVCTSVENIDLVGGIITTSDLKYLDHPWKPRAYERVQPKHPVRTIFSLSHWSVSACVADISVSGIGLLIYRMNNKPLNIEPGMPVQLGIRLPDTNSPQVIKGTIVRVNPLGSSAMISVGVQTYPTEKQARYIKTYVTARQTDILEELASIVRQSMEPAQTKDLFF